MDYAIGVDIGGTAIKIAVFTAEGTMRIRREIATRLDDSGKYILPDVCSEIESMLAQQSISKDRVLGVGVGAPGPVTDGRTVLRCVNLGWVEKDIASYVEQTLNLQCKVDNDANVAALGEAWMGASANTHSSVLLTLGTGIGGGIIVDGKILNGFFGGAGELGHAPIYEGPTERVCSCGNVYCLELYASASGIVEGYLRATGKELNCEEIFAAAQMGEAEALRLVDLMQRLIGRACAIVSCTVNPEIFVIGGGVSKAGEFLLEKIRAYHDSYVFPPIRGAQFTLAKLGNDAGMYGAVKLILGEGV